MGIVGYGDIGQVCFVKGDCGTKFLSQSCHSTLLTSCFPVICHRGQMTCQALYSSTSAMQKTAAMARVFGMKISALRRRTELSKDEKDAGLEVCSSYSALILPQVLCHLIIHSRLMTWSDKDTRK